MGPLEQAYNIKEIGIWPYETYQISPIDSQIDPRLGYSTFENNFPFYNNIGNNFKGYIDYDFRTIDYEYNQTKYRYQMDLSSGDSFYFSVSTTRKYFDGYVYNKFLIEFDPDLLQKGYVLYPTRLFLKPIAASKTISGWRLQTSAVLLSATPYYYQTFDQDVSSRIINQEYYSNYVGKIELPVLPALEISLSYEICASQQFNNKEILRFSDIYNPYQYNVNLEDVGTTIKGDSTHLYYDHFYYAENGYLSEISEIPSYNLEDLPYTVYILNYFPDIDPNTQTFLMLQSALDSSMPFNTYNNCVLTAVLDLNTTNFKYFASTRSTGPGSEVSVISGAPNTFIGLKYITDSVKIKHTNESVYNTVTYTNAAGSTLFDAVSSTQTGFDHVTWDLKYPPHYYNFNLKFRDASYYNQGSQESYLTFKLSANPISLTTDTVVLSTYIYSDFQLLKLDLPTYGILDYIKFDIITKTTDILLSSLCCYYGATDVPYYALAPQWIPAISANLFKITYPNLEYGEINLSVFPTLSTLAGYIQPYFSTDITLAKGLVPKGRNGIPISQRIISESADRLESIVLTADYSLSAFSDYGRLSSFPINPSRDVNGSNISWTWTPQDQYIELHSAQTLSSIIFGQSVPFSHETSRVVLSGYGPQTVVLTISSQLYNEVTSVTSTPSLFDPFIEHRFVVGSYNGLNNQNITRQITLTAAVPYKNRLYPLPNNYPIWWYWNYDGNTQNIPVSAHNYGSVYNISETSISNLLSTIDVFIEPPKTNVGEILHKVNVILQSNIDTISGNYSFNVDEFPLDTVLDPNFYTYYRNISSDYIASTYNSTVLSRPLDYTSKYDFVANDNLLNQTTNTQLVWTIQDNLLPLSSISGSSSIYYNITGARITHVTLSTLNTIAAGWVSGHSTSKTLTIYSLPPVEFNQPLLFNIYPAFYWAGGRALTISDTTNYTNSLSPTAYQNTVSNTYGFWVSANKAGNFNDYRYSIGVPQTSSISLLDIPYDGSFISNTGLSISLTAYGDEFPSTNGLFYKASGNGALTTKNFNITSMSIPFNIASITPNNRFLRSPKLIPYNSAVFSFSATLTSMAIDSNRYIYINQNIFSDPFNSPDQPIGGTITYVLSSDHWTAKTVVNALSGNYRIFALSIGDSYSPLTINDKSINTLYLTASANINKTIPDTTFENYPSYSGNKNLWNTISIPISSGSVETIFAYTTSGKLDIYISDYYKLTGTDITFDAASVYNGVDNPPTNYYIDYGDGVVDNFDIGESVTHSYGSVGSYNISLSALYQNGDIKIVGNNKAISIYNEWEKYDQSEIRFLDETVLVFPYTIEQIDIQPNEFGNVDIFNSAISRLEQNLDYIISNSRTINTDSPTYVYGWLGTNIYFRAYGISWHTSDYNSKYYNNPDLAVSEGKSYFDDIRSFSIIDEKIVVLDGKNIRYFTNGKTPTEIVFVNNDEFLTNFVDINHIDTNDTGDVVFATDTISNKLHRIELDVSNISYIFEILDIGGFGYKDDPNKFNSPDKVVYKNPYVYVLDYNNHCIKKYTEQLTWVSTYYSDLSANVSIETFDVHGDTGFVYALTSDYKVYIFDAETTEQVMGLDISSILGINIIQDLSFDESGEFFYILTENYVYKFSASGTYIGMVNIYNGMRKLESSSNRTIWASTKNYILKTNDLVKIFGIGDGLSKTGWEISELKLVSDEFASDVNYNRCLQRLVDNLKKYRDTLDSKFVLATEITTAGSVTYFAKQPIKISERPVFSEDIENDRVKIGVNELHIPQVFNREFSKIYDALETLRVFLNIQTVNASTSNGCQGIFCWSWKAMSCYNLSLPVVKLCNINPITFAELKSSFGVNYAPTKTWGEATSNCCSDVKSPLM